MRISKKILAIALSILMAVSMMPFTVFADALPTVNVRSLEYDEWAQAFDTDGVVAYEFTADDDEDSVQSSVYKDYLADFVISFDCNIYDGQIEVAGSYDGYNDGEWVRFSLPEMRAGEEYKLLSQGLKGQGYDYQFTYEDICTLVKSFKCAASGLTRLAERDECNVNLALNLYEKDSEGNPVGEPITVASKVVDYKVPTPIASELDTATLPYDMDAAYELTTSHDEDTVEDSAFKNTMVDLIVVFDEPIQAGDVTLYGSYDNYKNGEWIAIELPATGSRIYHMSHLLEDAGYEFAFSYDSLCKLVKTFRCGFKAKEGVAKNSIWVNLDIGGESAWSEEEEFGENTSLPTVSVEEITPENGEDVAYKYTANDDETSVQNSAYKDYLADFTISFDKAVAAGDVALSGSYQGYNGGEWVSFNLPALAAGEEYKLLREGLAALGYDTDFTYEDICTIVKEFKCAATGLNAAGVTATVKLNLYDPATGEATEIPEGTVEYTFAPADEFDVAIKDTLNFNIHIGAPTGAAKMVVEYNGSPEIEEDTRTEATVTAIDGDGFFNFSMELAPAQAYDDVNYYVFDAAGAVIKEGSTSLAEYLSYFVNDDTYGDLAKAIYDYAKAAAEYFNYNVDAYAQPYYYEVADFSGYSLAATDTTGKVTSVSYVATSEPALRFTVALTEEEAAALKATSNIGTASFAKRDGDIVLQVKDIPVSKLGETITVTVEGLGTVTYTPVLYAKQVSALGNSLARLGVSIANVNQQAAALL